MNHVLIMDNLLSNEDCDKMIMDNQSRLINETEISPWNYLSCDISRNHPTLQKPIQDIIASYTQSYPEMNLTQDPWDFDKFKLKKFRSGKFYDAWHSEHCVKYPYRIACLLLYLSDHDCGTEFYNGEVVKSKKGRGVLFPTLWTHTHRGQPCLEGKERYIMSSYINLIRE